MADHVSPPIFLPSQPETANRISRFGLHYDGTLNLDYFTTKVIAIENLEARVGTLWRDFKRNFVVSPLFLGLVLFVILFIPRRLFGPNSVLSDLSLWMHVLIKRSTDILISIVGLLGSSIVFAILPVLIRIDSKGKAIFKQTRVGQNRRRMDRRMVSLAAPYERRNGDRRKQDWLGKPFEIYKFRSMRASAERKTGPVWATPYDPRITGLGKLLRPLHVDEFPQFINVLTGDMSLVGPRPERPSFTVKFQKVIPNYEKRFQCKPGITGLAQVQRGYDSSIEDVCHKLNHDLDYIRNGSVVTDFKILLLTLKELVPNSLNGST